MTFFFILEYYPGWGRMLSNITSGLWRASRHPMTTDGGMTFRPWVYAGLAPPWASFPVNLLQYYLEYLLQFTLVALGPTNLNICPTYVCVYLWCVFVCASIPVILFVCLMCIFVFVLLWACGVYMWVSFCVPHMSVGNRLELRISLYIYIYTIHSE